MRAAFSGASAERPWIGDARGVEGGGGERRASARRRGSSSELELVPAKERKRYEREGLDARRRGERRARTQALEQMLRLGELWLRDVLCVCEGAG